MNDSLKVVTPPAVEPMLLAEAKAHLRIATANTFEDTLVTDLITVARMAFEEAADWTVISTVYDYALDRFPAGPIRLPRGNQLTAVGSVTYYDSDGSSTVWSSSLYDIDTHSRFGSIRPTYGESYPSFTPREVNPIIVRFTAGAENAAAVDGQIKHAIKLIIGTLFEQRESLFVGGNFSDREVDLRMKVLKPLIAPYVRAYAF